MERKNGGIEDRDEIFELSSSKMNNYTFVHEMTGTLLNWTI